MFGIDATTAAGFLAAAVALILAPGPDTAYVLARGLQARSRGVQSALGISTGVLVHTTAAALGLAALLRAAPTVYAAVKLVGAVYLCYLGVRLVRAEEAFDVDATQMNGHSYLRGVFVNALNPKVALFFLAFLPQFAGTGANATARMVLFGAAYALITAIYLSGVALASNRVGRAIRSPRAQTGLRWGAGSVMVGLGLTLVVGR